MVGGGKSPPHTENDVSRGRRFKLCGMIPLKIYSSGIFNFGKSPTIIAFLSKHQSLVEILGFATVICN
jgi:hypothetical protein